MILPLKLTSPAISTAVPIIRDRLTTLEPRTFPKETSDTPSITELIPTINSGIPVAMAIIMKPAAKWSNLRYEDILEMDLVVTIPLKISTINNIVKIKYMLIYYGLE